MLRREVTDGPTSPDKTRVTCSGLVSKIIKYAREESLSLDREIFLPLFSRKNMETTVSKRDQELRNVTSHENSRKEVCRMYRRATFRQFDAA